MTGAGLFDIADAIIDDAQVAPDGTIDYATLPPGGVTSDTYREAVVINVNGPLAGNFAAAELDGGGSISVASNTTLILNGSKGGTLIADAAGAVADISVSGAFTLGEAGKSGSGVIGDVLLDSSTASLTSAGNGSFTVGAVDAAVDGYGSVKATGGTLTVASIGATTPVGVADATDGALVSQGGINAQTVSSLNGSVQANDITAQTINSGANATVEALKDINAQRIVISDGTVLAGGSLTAAGFDIRNGLLQAAGDITISGPLASGDLTATGRVVSTNGNVTLQDKVAGLEGDIHAAGDITAQQEVTAPALSLIAGNAVKGTDIKVNSIYATRAETTGNLTVRSQLRLPGKGADASSVGGHLTLDRAYASVGDMTVNGNMILAHGSDATFDNLSVGGDISKIGLGSDSEGSTFTVREVLDLNGSVITVDPAWGSTSSNMAVNSINDDAAAADILINGGVAVGQNAYAAIGTADSAWLPAVAGPLSQDGASAALGIFRPVALAAGYKLYVNGALADTALAGGGTGYDAAPVDSATFEPGSLLVVNGGDAQIAGGTAAITFANSGTLHVADGLATVAWPCRMQKLLADPVIVDVTHTVDGARCLRSDIEEIYGSVVLVIGMLNDKDADGVVSELAPMCSTIYVTQPDSPRALPCEDLAETVRRHGRVDGVFRTIGEAMEAALDGRGDDNVLVTGSFRMAEGVLRWMAERSSRFSTRSQRSTWAERILAATRRV